MSLSIHFGSSRRVPSWGAPAAPNSRQYRFRWTTTSGVYPIARASLAGSITH
jgi:hypothetical protein